MESLKLRYSFFLSLLVYAGIYSLPEFSVKPYGYVAYDLYYDTRFLLSAREDFFVLFPLPPQYDALCQDINDHGHWQMTAIQSRLGVNAELKGLWRDIVAKGFYEADFLGAADPFISIYRLRFAGVSVHSNEWTFLAGRYWHPLFALDCFPDTICFNNGAPMEPQARAEQIRVTYTTKKYEIIAAALSQEEQFASDGEVGISDVYIRESLVPNYHIQARFFPAETYVVGVALDYLRLCPRIVTDNDFATNESINSFLVELYAARNEKKYQIRAKAVYAQNATNQLMISGYGVRTQDPVTNFRTYAVTQAVAGWIDMAYWFDDGTKSIGLFAGATKNLGATHPLFIDPATQQPIIYEFEPTVDVVARVSPRFRYKKHNMQIGLELECTSASYGKLNRKAEVLCPQTVTNFRVYFEILFFF
jgi:hypothetical protein